MNGIRPASPSEFEEIYAILETSFPPDERRAKEDQQALLQEERYTVYVLPDKETVAGFLTVWQFSDFAVVEHFAVNPAYRNQGLGGKMLAQLRTLLPCRIILEVELPETDFARRRIGFYQRNGYTFNEYPYLQPPYSKEKNALPLRIMSTDGLLSEPDFHRITTLMKQEIYKATK